LEWWAPPSSRKRTRNEKKPTTRAGSVGFVFFPSYTDADGIRKASCAPARARSEKGNEMNIALIGGVERRETDLLEIARQRRHKLEYHSGHVAGRGADSLRSLIERADLIVFQTAINSHGSMYVAKRTAQKLGKAFVVMRKCGPARLAALLALLPLCAKRIVHDGALIGFGEPALLFARSNADHVATSRRAHRA
jgi:hypothetical protein